MTIDRIAKMPTVVGNMHESVLQAYQILDKVKQMLKRGDSAETVLEIIEFIENYKDNDSKS